MRVLYFDCFAGVSGDMIIGALLDLGVDFDALARGIRSLGLTGYDIKAGRVERAGIAATRFVVEVEQDHQPHRSIADIEQIINPSSLGDRVKARSLRVFRLLAEVEARMHATTPDMVHFHEVGAVDSIIDTVGAMICFEALGVERFLSSALRLGYGFVNTHHGRLPVPAPATAELLGGVPVYAGDIEGEFVTPTGAAIVTTLAEEFGPLPRLEISKIGYGAGKRDPRGLPNALRIILGEAGEGARAESPAETVTVIETNIDDMNPQAFGFVMERAFALGALDVFLTPVQMKKGRPGVMLTALCERSKAEAVIDMLLGETTTLGVRYYEAGRRVLDRAVEMVETRYGSVRIKVARSGARTLHFQPEYDDCARLAATSGVPLIEVQSAAAAAYRERIDDQIGEGEKE